MIVNNYFIFSTYNSKETERVNYGFHEETKTTLQELEIPFKEVEGFYTHSDGTTSSELSFVVPAKHEQTVISIAADAGQESVLFVERGYGRLLYLDSGDVYNLPGRMTEVDSTEGLAAYTIADGRIHTIK